MRRREFLRTSALGGLFASSLLSPARSLLAQGPSPATDTPPNTPQKAILRGLGAQASRKSARGVPGILMHFLLTPEMTGGSMAWIEAKARKGMEPRPHVHQNEDEIIRLHAGRMRFEVGNETLEAGPGDVVFLPRRVRHGFELLTEEIHVDLLITPGTFAEYFWRFSTPVESLEIPPLGPEPPPAELLAAMQAALVEYGISPG